MACPGIFPRTQERSIPSISPSSPPARRIGSRSYSVVENRQLRSWPSAVRRSRSQSPQKGAVTEAMTPTEWGPPSSIQRAAGAPPRPGTGVSVHRADRVARISSCVTMRARSHV